MSSQQQFASYEDPVTQAELDRPHVASRSHRVPHDFVDMQVQGIVSASDGKTYFAMSCHNPVNNAQFYSYDPAEDMVTHIADLGAWCGESDSVGQRNTQGKVHSNIYESDGVLYLTTTSTYATDDQPYRGGHFLAYELSTGACRDLASFPDVNGGGLLSMVHEPHFRRLYALHQRDCTLVYYDLDAGTVVSLGQVQHWRQTRDMITDRWGNVYGGALDGMVWKYDAEADRISCLLTRIPSDPEAPQPTEAEDRGHTFWTQMRWDPVTEWWYGVRRNDDYLFRFRTPENKRTHIADTEGLVQFSHLPSAENQPRVGSFALTQVGRKLYSCSMVREWPAGRFVDSPKDLLDATKGVHLISYDIDANTVTDHGPVFTDGGRRVAQCDSLASDRDGKLYLCATVFSLPDEDPANSWQFALRHNSYTHMRFLVVDPERDLRGGATG